jgi:hypothetical protein
LHFRERSLCKKTVVEPDDDTVAIHSCYQCLGIDGIHECAAGKIEETAERVPGHIVAVGRENSTVSDDGEDHEHDKGEQTHAGFEGSVVTSELEEDRDHVYRDEDCGSACSGHGEEDEHSPGLEKLH